jgi:phosphatidylglycerophosphate synthase
MAAGGALINVSDGGRLLDPWTDSLLVASIFCCVLFGFVIGHFWFDD